MHSKYSLNTVCWTVSIHLLQQLKRRYGAILAIVEWKVSRHNHLIIRYYLNSIIGRMEVLSRVPVPTKGHYGPRHLQRPHIYSRLKGITRTIINLAKL
jgi:hypothetical protein